MHCKSLTVLLLILSQPILGQQNAASLEFFNNASDCKKTLGGWKCLELDLSSEAAIENDSTKNYEYSWNLGDGTRKQGNKIDYCYDQFGIYQVTMDLLDVETNTVIRNEMSSTVHLYPEIVPSIGTRSENLPPSFLEFTCQYNAADIFKPDRVFWKIEGEYYEGETIVQSFNRAGKYLIEMGIEKNTDLTGFVTACASLEITIKESDVWTAQVRNFIETTRKKMSAGPFTSSEVFCMIIPQGPVAKPGIIPINKLMSQVDIEEGHEYDIMLFSGNFFTDKKVFKTHGIIGNNLYLSLKDTISSFLTQPWHFFKMLTFEKDKTELILHEAELVEITELLLLNPYLKIQIGAYIHTGNRVELGIKTSQKRSAFIKEALVKHGVNADRISIASPEYNKSLINTCSAISDCNWEDDKLNGKVELKITGINL